MSVLGAIAMGLYAGVNVEREIRGAGSGYRAVLSAAAVWGPLRRGRGVLYRWGAKKQGGKAVRRSGGRGRDQGETWGPFQEEQSRLKTSENERRE